MELFGTTRSQSRRSHALIAPDSFVTSDLPGWERSQGIILIAPRMGARFSQYIAIMEPGGAAGQPPPGVERVIYVLEGQVDLILPGGSEQSLGPGGFAYCPPDTLVELRATAPSRLNVFEKRYVIRAGFPRSLNRSSATSGMSRAPPSWATRTRSSRSCYRAIRDSTWPSTCSHFKPGTTLPLVEVHVMEHGLLMLEGQGVYRLGDDWYPVQKGDVIWMAPFCPQWFVAMGKGPASYLYYKDVNRDPMEENA